ncbi:MAB_1171c family putative transporter [Amycolatopsis sp. NPDC004747]
MTGFDPAALGDPTVIAAAIATACSMYLLRSVLRRPENLALRAAWLGSQIFAVSLCLGLLVYGLHLLVPIPARLRWISIAQHVTAMTAAYLGYSAYVFMANERNAAIRHVKRHGLALLAVLAPALTAAIGAPPEDFYAGLVADYANSPVSACYLTLFTAYVAVAVTGAGTMSWRWSRLVDEPWIRRGLVIGTIGYALAGVYCAVRTTFIVMAVTGDRIPVKEGAVTGWLIAAALPFVLIGVTVPGWGPRLAAALRWWRLHRAFRRLHPLWSELTAACPHVRMPLGPSRLARRFGSAVETWWDDKWSPHPHDLPLRLHLRVVQIWDARRALLGHCDVADYDRVLADPRHRRRRTDVRAAYAEGAMLRAGLRRHRAGAPGRRTAPALPAGVETADLAANVIWLQHVAKGLRGKTEPAT